MVLPSVTRGGQLRHAFVPARRRVEQLPAGLTDDDAGLLTPLLVDVESRVFDLVASYGIAVNVHV